MLGRLVSLSFMFYIGDLKINSTSVLAPMAGITSEAYRTFMRPFGVALTYTEMISDCGLIYGNPNTWELLKIDESDHPIAVQLFGSSKETLVKAISILENSNLNYDILDINLACPVPKVTKSGAGSALLKDLDKLEDLMSAITKVSSKPVTAKIRLGIDKDSINFLDTIATLEKSGVKAVALHLRTAAELYSGKAHYEMATNLRDKMHVPLIISGDIFTLEDAIRAKEITKCDAIMVARGGVGNPFLIKKIEKYFNDGELIDEPTFMEQLDYLLQYTHLLIKEKGEVRAIKCLRGIAPKFLMKFPRNRYYRNLLSTSINCEEDIYTIVETIKGDILSQDKSLI